MQARQIHGGDGLLLMVGTTKGAFLLHSDRGRRSWEHGGPYLAGHEVYALAFDGRNARRRIWASQSSNHWGAVLRVSDDFGRTWSEVVQANVKFPAGSGASLQQIWQIQTGRPEEPEVLWCGVAPAALFQSRDGGASWQLVQGLWDHPHREKWSPGFGGLCLHTILPHPQDRERMLVAISTGGVYRTEDAGRTWRASNRGVRADFLPDKHPEFGQCVHKIARSPSRPDRLFLQNHGGLYRSDDDGESWEEIAQGVPSDFGFPVVAHPQDPHTAWVLPLESAGVRCTPEGKLRVFRTRNGGMSWQALAKGLPQHGAYETVLRDGMATDGMSPAGLYFGTRSGKIWGSIDEGRSWRLLLDGLPPVVCLKAAVIGRTIGEETSLGRAIVKSPRRRKQSIRAPGGRVRRKAPRRKKPRPRARPRSKK